MGVNVRWLQKLESGEINIKNISFVNGLKLLTALGEYENDITVSNAIEIVYEMLKAYE